MNYEPKTEEQLAKEDLLPEGTYDFEVIDTSDRPSKKGNDMIMLKLGVYDSAGSERIIFDYIVPTTNFGERKLRKAAQACGLLDIYMAGDLNDRTFMGATGKAVLKQQDGTDGFMPKNVVAEYLPRDDVQPQSKKPTREIIDDEIPFAWAAALLIPLASIIASKIV